MYKCCSVKGRPTGFTLVELLVVMALLGILGTFLVPAISSATERSRVGKVLAELHQIEVALTLYYDDYGKYPPVRVSCNSSEQEHWCELPTELVTLGYLPPSEKKGVSSMMEDPFNPGHTYKYIAPGPYYLNGALQKSGFAVFVPEDFPGCKSQGGSYHDKVASPLAWVVWSLGPRQNRNKALSGRAPVSSDTWYKGTGDHGVIARIRARHGTTFQTL